MAEPGRAVHEKILAVERQELEHLAAKLHDRHQHPLAETWRQCSEAICARIRSWLDLLVDDAHDDDSGVDGDLLG